MVRALLDLIFPPRCLGCGQRGEWICPACLGALPRLPAERCRRCAEPRRGVAVCSQCWRDPPEFGSITAGFAFEGTVRAAIHHLKFRRARHLAEPLAEALVHEITAEPPELVPAWSPGALLVPVPLHPRRQAERGYNQSALLARAIGARLGLEIGESVLARSRDTPPQLALPAGQRRVNVNGAFRAIPTELGGRSVVLVDDVATTTSTLRAAAAALREVGAPSVDAIVLARAIPKARKA